MNEATSALLAVLLVLAVPATVATAATADGDSYALQREPALQSPTELENTTNRLELSGEIRSEHAGYSGGLGTELASADDELRVDHTQYAVVDDGFEAASADERTAMIQAAYDRLTDRIDDLEERERRAVREHAAGDRSSTALLRTLVRNQHEAEVLSEHIAVLEDRADRVPGYSLSSGQVRATYKALEKHQTPLRSNLEQQVTTAGDEVVVSTSQSGYSVAMIDGSQYVVETTRFDARGETDRNRFDDGEAYDHVSELYPWASEFGPHFQDNSPDYYWAEMAHDQGRLEFYFDGDTGDVYHEIQVLSTDSLPVTDGGTWSEDGLEMTINETPANGPIEVQVTDSESGEPVDATVTADGAELGSTGEDGALWLVPPADGYDLAVESNDRTVNATITVD
ncbi:hypothetical protein A6E15_00740 [Natrinema saccharevitans]|uniref:Uncharacterized protein n=1 Tax=Natrinema saccharevitans TaxID=301967 RepID=A0A1S8ARZ3_9EURY|nr:hypothetical protein [Natrinema saccharevitans]OLZ39598.1 hypothetical protein A6E15_00740 [Natrinema saccharevitans]